MPPPHRSCGRVSEGRKSGGAGVYKYGNPNPLPPYYYWEWEFFWREAFDLLYGDIAEEDDEPEEEEDKEIEAPPKVIEKIIHVEEIDLHIGQNAFLHRTKDFHVTKSIAENRQLVVRRGEEFTITIQFNEVYDPAKYDLLFKFKIGGDPRPGPQTNPGVGTYIELLLDESGTVSDDISRWHARLAEKKGKSIVVKIRPSCQAVIGEWDFHVYTMKNDADEEEIMMHFKLDSFIIILLNPWCKDDTVYFEEDPQNHSEVDPRDEYILNQTGFLYCGSSNHIRSKPWRFGQFDKDVLSIALKVLRLGARGYVDTNFSDPIKISRMISQTVNESGDQETKGVLVGNWSGNYDDGESPTSWTGTPDILRKFKDNNYRPVKYGQCWVFSGVVTTVSRALGLPCRSVTNFSSAHDSDGSNVVDRFFNPIDASNDSIWNFHVWNETWMRRPDVPGSDGWQITDATPQEMSHGLYRLGPCSVRDVKLGRVSAPYDAAFVHSEVNADIVWWERRGGRLILNKTDTNSVGKNISTKVPDGKATTSKPLDVTSNYKFREGSTEERLAARNAQKHGKQSYGERGVEVHDDVKLSLTQPDDVLVGQPFTITLSVKNTSLNREKLLRIKSTSIVVESFMYTGNKRKRIKRQTEKDYRMKPDETKTFTCEVEQKDYIKHISDHLNFKAYGIVELAGVRGYDRGTYCENVTFELQVPLIHVKVKKVCRVGDEIPVKLAFKNPLPVRLTKCKIGIETEKFYDYKDRLTKDFVEPNEDWKMKFTITAHTAGPGQVSAVFDSKELVDIVGFMDIDVVE